MVPDDSSIGKSKPPEKLKSPQVLAKEWQTVDKFAWINRFRYLPLSASQKHLLHAMAVYANPDGSKAFPSIKTLASDMSMDRKTVNGHVIKLREAGWLIAEGRVGTFNRTIRYRINIGKILSYGSETAEANGGDYKGDAPLSKERLVGYGKRRDTAIEGGFASLSEGEQRPASAMSNHKGPDLARQHGQPSSNDEDQVQLDALKALYLSWREKSITKGVLKVLMADGATVEYWKARLEPAQGKKVKNPTAYLRKCLENDPPSEFEPPPPAHKQYTSGEWADYIES